MGVFVVDGGAIEHALKFEAGLPTGGKGETAGLVEDVVGRWPDDAWLLFQSFELSPCPESVYRWRGDRWVLAQAPFLSLGTPSLQSWGEGGALLTEREPIQRIAGKDSGVGRDLLQGLGIRAGRPRRLASLPHCNEPLRIDAEVPFANGALIAAFRCPLDLQTVIERWSSPESPAKRETLPASIDAGAPVIEVEGIGGDDPDDVTVFGGVESSKPSPSYTHPDRAYIAHFNGHTWSEETAPPGAHTIGAYIRDAGGSSWAIANPYDLAQLWSKEPNGAWRAVELPRIADGPAVYNPVTLTKAEDGMVWVWCRVRPGQRVYLPSAALLSTFAPSRVVELENLF